MSSLALSFPRTIVVEQVSYCKADPKTTNAAATPGGVAAPIAGDGESASANWKLDHDDGGAGMKMDSTNRATLMARLGGATAPGAIPNVPGPAGAMIGAAAAASAATAAAATSAAMNMSLPGIPSETWGV